MNYHTIRYGDEIIVYEVATGKVVDHVTESEMKERINKQPSAWYKFWEK